ncbi:hypothetical protein EDEG_03592 [Edhazardia aedis USNM 41457]|uniref:Uncharacterized protein n=1 Tax=Edhazardia aedis (strain USNM 41457) TaxID=1003232 RepID=J8ZQG8_EDHAE|nr:hypothetical protein EDEG_03592 [Edhazardia aedis USNM 41457]|eukprot:EJW01948.1 hypothetical protein EDEG_03592 [Edhazardia aedis USNM 41457]
MNFIKAINKDDCVMGNFSTKYDAERKLSNNKNNMTIIQIVISLLSFLFRRCVLLSILRIVLDCEFVTSKFSSCRIKMMIFHIMTRLFEIYHMHIFLQEMKLEIILDKEKKVEYCKRIIKNRKDAHILKELNRKFVVFIVASFNKDKKADDKNINCNKMT